MATPDTHKAWYKTTVGIIFLIFLLLFFVFLLIFAGFFLSYSWQLRFGDAEALEQQFNADPQITVDASLQQSEVPAEQATQPIETAIRPFNPTFGNPNAEVAILAFIDFECPFCLASFPIFKSVMERYEPAIHVVFKNFPLSAIHPFSVKAGLGAACAHDQGQFWNYYNVLFEERVYNDRALNGYANDLGLDVNQFSSCLSRAQFQSQLDTDLQDGIALGVRGTPTYFVNQRKVEGVITEEQWNTVLLEAIQGN